MKHITSFLITVFIISSFPMLAAKESKASKLFFLNKNFGGFVKRDNIIAITRDGGLAWAEVLIVSDEKIRKLLFRSENTGWGTADSALYKTTDGGESWFEHTTFDFFRINSLSFTNPQKGYVYGIFEYNTDATAIYYTNDGGNSWTNSQFDSIYHNGVQDISFANDTIGMAVASQEIIKTLDGGKNWFSMFEYKLGGDGQITPKAIKMFDEETVMLIGGEAIVVAQGFINLSNDGGFNWVKYGNGQYFKWGIKENFILNQDSVWLIANDRTTYATANTGNNWKTLDVKLDEFSFISNKTAYGIDDKYILYTEDGWDTYSIVDSTITDINIIENIPGLFKLYQNYPNPFNPATTIKYSIPSNILNVGTENFPSVEINIYDILGREVAALVNQKQKPGNYEVVWDASDYTSGIYFYRIQSGEFTETKKMLLLK